MLDNKDKNRRLIGEVTVPGDKSISHRAIMLGALCDGDVHITNFLEGADCLSTIDCFKKMGIDIERDADKVTVHGKGINGLKAPEDMLDTGNSGTTTRLISGILSAQDFTSHLNGDESIQKRPMKRIMEPLSMMGADIKSDKDNGCAPLTIKGCKLHGIDYVSKIASAQVKSAILFAGLYADGETSVDEPYISRDHSERMLKYFGYDVKRDGTKVSIKGGGKLSAKDVEVPGDISSAAYFIAAGLITPGSDILIKNVGINETRDGIIKVAKEMGGDIELLNIREDGPEPLADIRVKYSDLHGIRIDGKIIPTLIDEIPIIAIMALAANGETVIADAAELKVKESDRIAVMTENINAMGGDVTPTDDGMIIRGGKALKGAKIDSHKDHRIAMSFYVASYIADGVNEIKDFDCVKISYPGFLNDFEKLTENM